MTDTPIIVAPEGNQTTVVVATTTFEVSVFEEDGTQTTVTTPDTATIVTAVTPGPQGATGGTTSFFRELQDVDIDNAVNNSLLYFNAATNKVLGTDTWTTENITDGGNF